jgi:hypothetical protein
MMRARQTLALAVVVGLTSTAVLAARAPEIGFPRDEGIYFDASRRYGAWVSELVRAPRRALAQAGRDRAFSHNREHPPLMKLAAGASARALGPDEERPGSGLISESAAMRLPAQALTGLCAAILFWIGASLGRARPRLVAWSVGAVAAGWWLFAPRVAFHGSLHTFDAPIAVATLVVVLLYRRARSSWRWSLGLGVALGLAVVIKHNALFIPFTLLAHHAWTLAAARRNGAHVPAAALAPPAFVSMAILAPLVAWACWPWMWTDPLERLSEYAQFHAQHSYYNMEFLGVNYNRPPLPTAYPWVMTLATVSSSLLALSLVGIVKGPGRRDADPTETTIAPWGRWHDAQPTDWPEHDRLLIALFALFPLALIALPTVPIFGGTKHWLTAYPFAAWAAAWTWLRVERATGWRPPTFTLATVAVLGPAAWSTLHAHPVGLSQYAPLVGGARGAAEAGLNRGFWGYAIGSVLDEADAEDRTRVYPHDIHPLAAEQYRRDGRWPTGWVQSPPERARAGFVFHERHMRADEVRVWNALGTQSPARVVTLDDVPLTSFYAIE